MKDQTLLILGLIIVGIILFAQKGPTALKGDVNGDGVVDSGDIIALKRIIEGLDPPNPRADVNGDGKIDQADIDMVKQIILAQG